MEFRKVTDLEKISELGESSYILVVENDMVKRISKSDAEFGGGVTTFYVEQSLAPSSLAVNDKPVALSSDTEANTEANTETRAKINANARIATRATSRPLYVDKAMTREVTVAEAWAAACAGTVRIAYGAGGILHEFALVRNAYINDMSASGDVTQVAFYTQNDAYYVPTISNPE